MKDACELRLGSLEMLKEQIERRGVERVLCNRNDMTRRNLHAALNFTQNGDLERDMINPDLQAVLNDLNSEDAGSRILGLIRIAITQINERMPKE